MSCVLSFNIHTQPSAVHKLHLQRHKVVNVHPANKTTPLLVIHPSMYESDLAGVVDRFARTRARLCVVRSRTGNINLARCYTHCCLLDRKL
jgi:hypothetical protein